MRAAVLRGGEIVVRDDVPEPEPGVGQVLVEVEACGICGSDLHFAQHGGTMLDLGRQMKGMPDLGDVGPSETDLSRDVFMGHEFSATVLDTGPDTEALPAGTTVTSLPVLMSTTGFEPIVYCNDIPGGYSERMLLSAPMLLEVPNGLDARHAALTEPMAVGLHAVNKSEIQQGNGALVLGCGPVGLAVIAALQVRGIDPIVAADFSAARRATAEKMGAHVTVDAAQESAFDAWAREGGGKPVVVFEAIGVPGILDEALRDAPQHAKILVVGVCMERDSVVPFYGAAKELSIQFAMAYDPMEFASCLRAIAEGEIDVAPMITGEVDLAGIPQAFDDLADPEEHCKILVVPGS
ncbi:MAG: zinc-binding dehydrogenase [Acidimicrobiales bacterium]|nr:zinc-binding dehydrogenase [Acidimicrobiales bacterium]